MTFSARHEGARSSDVLIYTFVGWVRSRKLRTRRAFSEEETASTLSHAADSRTHLGATRPYGRDVGRINAFALRHSSRSCLRISETKETADVMSLRKCHCRLGTAARSCDIDIGSFVQTRDPQAGRQVINLRSFGH